jgi:hypothetical protein
MTDSTNVVELKRTEKMVSYAKALGNFCDTFYDATEPYIPHGDCPFWDGSVCILQNTHPSDWSNFKIILNDIVKESS